MSVPFSLQQTQLSWEVSAVLVSMTLSNREVSQPDRDENTTHCAQN